MASLLIYPLVGIVTTFVYRLNELTNLFSFTFLLDNNGLEEATQNGESAAVTATALMSTNDTNDDAVTYDISYKNLREWIENSLDWYKVGREGNMPMTWRFGNGSTNILPLFYVFVHAVCTDEHS